MSKARTIHARRIAVATGRYIAAARKSWKLSQRDLAWKIDGSRSIVAHVEQGRQPPTIAVFCALCDVLGLDPPVALARILVDAQRSANEMVEKKKPISGVGCIHCAGIKQHDPRCAFVVLKAPAATQRRALRRRTP